MRKLVQNLALVLAALTVSLMPAAAQVNVGQSTEITAGGDISFGFSGFSGNQENTTHSFDVGGYGFLRGNYYSPQFLSFDIQPYYQRSQNNSIFQTITNGSGITATTSIFSGSHFPGYVSYGRTFDSTGQFGVPGITGIASHGNGNNFTIGWSELLPGLPTLSASYAISNGTSTVFGANTASNAGSRSFNLQSTYNLAGFELMGQYLRLSTNSDFPSFFEGVGTQQSNTRSNSEMLIVGHSLPLAGHWNMVWNHSNYAGEYRSGTSVGSNDGTVNNVNTLFSLTPTHKLGLAFGGNYNDNAYGALQEKILESGGVPLTEMSSSLRTASVNGQASYSVFSNLAVIARVNHYELWMPGDRRGMTQFSGVANFNYARSFLGALTFSAGVIDTATQDGNSGANLIGSVNFLRRTRSWELGGDFSYSQQVETLFGVYTTSTYRYGAQVGRKIHTLRWRNSFTASQSGMTQIAGYSSSSEGFTTGVQYHRYTADAQYSQSAGSSILTSAGLIELPPGIPPPLLQQPILYNARSYGGGVGLSPFRRSSINVNYNTARSATAGPGLTSGFKSTIFNARFTYRLRKLDLEANYTRFDQSISTLTMPTMINSYYIRVSRWFNFF